jgi:hypothetical protein
MPIKINIKAAKQAILSTSTYKMQETAKLFPKFLQFFKNFRDLTGNSVIYQNAL